MVGEEDAAQTPESVLALTQPAIMMGAVDQGIGGLAAEEMSGTPPPPPQTIEELTAVLAKTHTEMTNAFRDLHQGRFARAVGADDADLGAAIELQVDLVEHRLRRAGEALGHALHDIGILR